MANMIFSQPRIQNDFWPLIQSRLNPDNKDWFMRHVADIRRESCTLVHPVSLPAIAFVGSSQVRQGIDWNLMETLLPDYHIRNCAVPGMDMLRACFAEQLLLQPSDRVVVLWISELDVRPDASLGISWMRPFATWSGLRHSIHSLNTKQRARQWRNMVDLALASTFELWRSRDYLRHILFHSLSSGSTRSAVEQSFEGDWRKDVRTFDIEDMDALTAQMTALFLFVSTAKANGASIVVFEGRVNPSICTETSEKRRSWVRERLLAAALEYGFDYIPTAQQQVQIEPADWSDMTHFNVAGREKMTRYLAQFFNAWRGRTDGPVNTADQSVDFMKYMK
ncbi:MAG: hypothetical protein A2X46_05030 [Lentisphaerae bacterium GWF2_57_35]|nr:MAG: hypothetical protein A2X46_05030 [Lentisphaerae bacterium GWF2_57_35]